MPLSRLWRFVYAQHDDGDDVFGSMAQILLVPATGQINNYSHSTKSESVDVFNYHKCFFSRRIATFWLMINTIPLTSVTLI
jgi:hypothetical protein